MTWIEAYQLGKEHAKGIAPQFPFGELTTEDEFLEACFEAEENSRQYTPFEFTAKELNDSENPEELWDAFERGIARTFQEDWKSLQA